MEELDDFALKCKVSFKCNEVKEINGINFKKSLYKEGKLNLFKGSFDECKEILEDLGFRPWLVVKKQKCKLYDLKDHGIITIEEFIPEIGWTGELEIEGDDIEAASKYIKKSMELLQIKEYTFKSVAALVGEAKNLI